jgi:hypothetical protein
MSLSLPQVLPLVVQQPEKHLRAALRRNTWWGNLPA